MDEKEYGGLTFYTDYENKKVLTFVWSHERNHYWLKIIKKILRRYGEKYMKTIGKKVVKKDYSLLYQIPGDPLEQTVCCRLEMYYL